MEKLSDDILEDIFQYLDQKSLINILFTCQRLQDFVICSGKMMKKLPVKLSARSGINSVLHTVLSNSEKIRDLQLYGNVSLDRFNHTFESIRKVGIYYLNSTPYHENQVKIILNSMTHLETLNMCLPPFNVTQFQEKVVLMPKFIKVLSINYHHIKSLSDQIQTQELTINFSNADTKLVAPQDVLSFILHQTKLHTLVLTDLNLNSYALFSNDVSKLVECKLQELKLIRCQFINYENTNHELFLKANTQLKRITILGSDVSNIWNIVTETLLQLYSIEMSSSSIDGYGIVSNLNVKKLILKGHFAEFACNAIWQRFPAISELHQIGHIGFSAYRLSEISSSFPELLLFKIGILQISQLQNNAVYGNLKTLEIDLVDFKESGMETWNTFIKVFPALQNLTVWNSTSSEQFPKELLDLLLKKTPILQCLSLGGSLLQMQLLHLIVENPRNLTLLKFQKNSNISCLKDLEQQIFSINSSVSLQAADFHDPNKWCFLNFY